MTGVIVLPLVYLAMVVLVYLLGGLAAEAGLTAGWIVGLICGWGLVA